MKRINIFIESRNHTLTDSSQKLVNYFNDIQSEYEDFELHIYHFVSSKETSIKPVNLTKVNTYYKITISEVNLFANLNEVEPVFDALNHSNGSKYFFAKSLKFENLASLLSKKLNLPVISNIVGIKNQVYFKEIFSGKALAELSVSTDSCVVIFAKSLKSSSVVSVSNPSDDFQTISLNSSNLYQIENHSNSSTSIPLPEAQIVVGAGRGLKDPSNWGIIEDLAKKLGAATACSKPVSDLDWRPHHEHVGQTGVKISPKLYIACGISGAIQHLAGVNNSGKIVVINNDPEAPFFKNADYGIVGDVFEILPKLLKKLN
jgi:electron transfer flavoprotein alpha subunit